MKKIFSYIGIATILSLSIIISERTTTVVKNIDTLMTEIKEKQLEYNKEPMNAIIEDNTIIPGLYGKKINIQQTYDEMKKIGKFNEKYIKYEQTKPEITLENNYDKYIISGNKEKNTISLIFLLYNDDNVEQIKKTLKKTNTKATFFIDKTWLEKHNKELIELINDGHTIGTLSYNQDYQNIEYTLLNDTLKKQPKQTNNYCYDKNKNIKTLKKCALNKNYTIRPTIIIKDHPLKEIKQKITRGALIELPTNDKTNKELELIIKYVKSKGYNIKNLDDHISEKNNN